MDAQQNRRQSFRMPFIAEVFCRDTEKKLICSGKLKNISGLGIYFTTSDRPPLNTACECEIIIAGQASRLVMDEIKASVIRHDEKGIALHLEERLEWIALIPILFRKGQKTSLQLS